jgi:hypothetical protein
MKWKFMPQSSDGSVSGDQINYKKLKSGLKNETQKPFKNKFQLGLAIGFIVDHFRLNVVQVGNNI